jgi:predicted RNase H-related nuclease YkuK (DUF458 family)
MRIDFDEVAAYLKTMPEGTKIYFGSDSERIRLEDGTWVVDYLLVMVIHEGGNKGAKVFGEIQRDRDYDRDLSRPKNRLMTEVYKISELFLRLKDLTYDFETEVHLDINPSIKHGSSVAVKEAVGYIRGLCMLEPVIKPHSWAASNCADALRRLMNDVEKGKATV